MCVQVLKLFLPFLLVPSDDYRFTAAMSLLKLLVIRGANSSSDPSQQEHTPSPPPPPPLLPPPSSSSMQKSPRTPAKRGLNGGVGGEVPAKSPAKSSKPAEGAGNDGPIGEPPLQLAIKVCQAYLDSLEHKDIDSSHHHHPVSVAHPLSLHSFSLPLPSPPSLSLPPSPSLTDVNWPSHTITHHHIHISPSQHWINTTHPHTHACLLNTLHVQYT